jgi:DNA-binding NarL/FixJ family response regulator
MPASPIKFIIADDHKMFRQSLGSFLSSDPAFQLIGDAGNGLELLNELKVKQPDIVLLDLTMPEMDGIEATKRIRAEYPDVKILIVTMSDDEPLVLRLLEIGANGYLTKNTDTEEIKLALRACVESGYYFGDYVSTLMLKSLVHKKQATPTFKNAVLSEREKEVLQLICEGKTAAQIGKQIFLSPRTVEGIRSSLFEKTGTRNIAGLVMYATKNGIVS